jgi:hypothetical protein
MLCVDGPPYKLGPVAGILGYAAGLGAVLAAGLRGPLVGALPFSGFIVAMTIAFVGWHRVIVDSRYPGIYCPHCRYDLAGVSHLTDAVYPECGKPVPPFAPTCLKPL